MLSNSDPSDVLLPARLHIPKVLEQHFPLERPSVRIHELVGDLPHLHHHSL